MVRPPTWTDSRVDSPSQYLSHCRGRKGRPNGDGVGYVRGHTSCPAHPGTLRPFRLASVTYSGIRKLMARRKVSRFFFACDRRSPALLRNSARYLLRSSSWIKRRRKVWSERSAYYLQAQTEVRSRAYLDLVPKQGNRLQLQLNLLVGIQK